MPQLKPEGASVNPSSQTNASHEVLSALRMRLLDLTANNRLLNFRHGGRAVVRVVDERPDQLYGMLLDEQELRFLAVPEPSHERLKALGWIQSDPQSGEERALRPSPSASEWASVLGMQRDYELAPAADAEAAAGQPVPHRYRDRAIQTLMYPRELESRLRGLKQRADTAIEESGANLLYLAFGFLEWFERDAPARRRLAPLVLVPARIEKGRLNRAEGTFEYTLSYSGEDLLTNLSLREKLARDFSLALPELDDEELPSTYFAAVAELIARHRPNWRVRGFATLGLFNFSRLMMYLDLDPRRWPAERPLADHRVVATLLGSGEQPEAVRVVSTGEPYRLDAIDNLHRHYPLIYDADSSQHSAVIDAVDGADLVIEGPPGTGKSQTITNLIAAALARGERVLFVAEKLAALEVVKRRLDQAGLGELCLELHSHKTQKRRVLGDIAVSLARRGKTRKPKGLDEALTHIEGLQRDLGAYAEASARVWKGTGRSVQAILAAALRGRLQLGIDPASLGADAVAGGPLDDRARHEALRRVRAYAAIQTRLREQLGGEVVAQHPWYGLCRTTLQPGDAESVCDLLGAWQQTLERLCKRRDELLAELDLDGCEGAVGLEQGAGLVEDLDKLIRARPGARLDVIPTLSGAALSGLETKLALHRQVKESERNLAGLLTAQALADPALPERLEGARERIAELAISLSTPLKQLLTQGGSLAQTEATLAEIAERCRDMRPALGDALGEEIGASRWGLHALSQLLELVLGLRPALCRMRDPLFDNEALDEALPVLAGEIATLSAERERLDLLFRMDAVPDATALDEMLAVLADSGVLSWFSGRWRSERKRFKGLARYRSTSLKALLAEANALRNLRRREQDLAGNRSWQGLLGQHFAGLSTPIDDMKELRAWYRSVRAVYGLGFGPRAAGGDALLALDANLAQGLRALAGGGLARAVAVSQHHLAQIERLVPGFLPLADEGADLVGEQGLLPELQSRLEPLVWVARHLAEAADGDLHLVPEAHRRWQAHALLLQQLHDTPVPEGWGGLGIDAGGRMDAYALAELTATISLARLLESGLTVAALGPAVRVLATEALFEHLAIIHRDMQRALELAEQQQQAFAEAVGLDRAAWMHCAGDRVSTLIARNRRALDKPDWLAGWLDYLRMSARIDELGLAGLTRATVEGRLPIERIEDGVNLLFDDGIAREILREDPQMAVFMGGLFEQKREELARADRHLKRLQREQIAWQLDRVEVPEGIARGRVGELTELALLRHECGKKMRHIPLRQLVLRSTNALLALKPCFMMGPMSVAQYLAPGEIAFDLVVMDEASQVRPEDALGAIARGARLVVVGDPRQLPPTSFFDRMDEATDEEAGVVEEAESILDAATGMFPTRYLDWHYRSLHERLIRFSNQQFYDHRLVVFPSPYSECRGLGVNLERVAEGLFVERRNVAEARSVALAVAKHLRERPGESIGVVAMSAQQRDAIESAVEELAKSYPVFQEALDAERIDSDEPLFIKNLENVQGDERDLILISLTYGPAEPGGRVYQRFGPINGADGWRRLNVLFTRAKREMRVYSSMGPEDIKVSDRSSRGVRVLKEFLSYAAAGAEAPLERDPDHANTPAGDDLQAALSHAIGQAGFATRTAIGGEGVLIDLAAGRRDGPSAQLGLIGDGPHYAGAASVNDRDQVVDAVLARLGWRVRRVWTPEWYRNPDAELAAVIAELENLGGNEHADDLSLDTET